MITNRSISRLLVLAVMAIALVSSCSESDVVTYPDVTLSITCPADTIVPINLSDPDEIGVYPTVVSNCVGGYALSSRDSIPEGMSGGLIRIWEAADSCGNSVRCLQSIGLGAPQ